MKFKKIEVLCNDLTFFTDKVDLEDLDNCTIEEIKISGYLVKETKDILVVACSLYKSGKIGDFYIIPKKVIKGGKE